MAGSPIGQRASCCKLEFADACQNTKRLRTPRVAEGDVGKGYGSVGANHESRGNWKPVSAIDAVVGVERDIEVAVEADQGLWQF